MSSRPTIYCVSGLGATLTPFDWRQWCQSRATSTYESDTSTMCSNRPRSVREATSKTFVSWNVTSSPTLQGHETRSLSTVATSTPVTPARTLLTLHQNLSPSTPTFTQEPGETRGVEAVAGRSSKWSRWECSSGSISSARTGCPPTLSLRDHLAEPDDDAALNLAEKSEATFIAAQTRRSQLPLS